MEGILDADAPLHYATIQIFPTQNRYEVFVCGDNKVEKLAVGPLEQLLPYIPGLKPLHAKGSYSNFTTQPAGKASSAAWFTKSTLNRFLNIVGSPDLVNITKIIEGEMSQLEEARQFHLSLYVQGNNIEAGEIDDCNSNGMAPQTKSNVQAASSDTSKNELLRAMDLRISALRGELAAAFKQAAGAIFSNEELANLVELFQHFGLADSNNSFFKDLDTSQMSQSADPLDDNKVLMTCASRNNSARMTNGSSQMPKPSHAETLVKYGVSPAKVAQLERQSSTGSESSDSGEENQTSIERSRALVRSAAPRRSASPMRRIQIGRTGSRRATAITIKSLNSVPTRILSHRDVAADIREEEGSEQTSKKIDNNVRRMSVQDAINLFESKQRDQTADSQKRNCLTNASLIGNKSVLRRWSSGMGESSAQSHPQTDLAYSSPVISNDIVDKEFLKASVEVNSESDHISDGQTRVEAAEVDVQLERQQESNSDVINVQADADVNQREDINERLTASSEWNRQKEGELNQMLKKMMESKPTKSKKLSTSRNHNLSSEKRGSFYDHYREKRDEKLRGENARKRADKEAQFRAMQQSLDERKAEMASKNMTDVGKKHPLQKPQKLVRNLPKSASPKKEIPRPAVVKKASSKTSPLPTTRKSWPSGSSPRAAGISPAKTPGGISSAGTVLTRRKPQSAQSFPRATSKVDQSKQQLRNVKEAQANNERSSKGLNGKQLQTKAKSSKNTKVQVATASRDSSSPVPAKPSFYNKVTRKSSVVPLESKPFLRKGSRTGPGVDPAVNKIKNSSQVEDSLRNPGNLIEPQEKEAVSNASSLAMEHQEHDIVPLDHCDSAMKLETTISSQQICNDVENFDEPATDNDDSLKNMMESSYKIQPEEESIISPAAWVEIEEEHHELPNACHDNTTQLASPANVLPIGLSSPRVRHSLSQMLQEESSEPDSSEWGNAENPPAMVYQKDAPKGLKRLLKFARKSKGDASSTGWSSPSVFSEGEDDTDESRAANKRNADNLLRKAALHAKNYGVQRTSLSEDYGKKVDAHLVSAQSNISRYDTQNSNKLHKGHVSAAAPTNKGTRSFFSLSAFRGSKPNETKLQ
ncbi:uncharacterized protein LOC123193070 [Mangifera indica]|uniref:uncharacterized protein LOC123193070 n=1 Tax=Mangifera indica TaxID=29780 RepID=UPI001CFBE8F4|nr:uncharacterized protein LOC123193070 [Mangifera indica]XP_044461792.1 uncharacterized protein LOC123193070 [Mangifera indica]XP_044461793.1 uncharacterized protein LOC123193070 [Mangifera indica]